MAPESIGSYQIEAKIGAGGMGTVYRAHHSVTGRVVALKVMRGDSADDPSFLARFRREASIARSISSPNVVAVLDAGDDGGTPFIAMELVEGQTLASIMREHGPLPAPEVIDIATQVAQGLYAAYQKGITHRDVSPQNILITPDGTVKLADFGVARADGSGTLTSTGMLMGKPAYIAPELLENRGDTRSDIYSLGIVMFEMLSGEPPFVGPTPLATMNMHVTRTPPRLADIGVIVPGDVEKMLTTCLAKSPSERFQSPRELVLALTALFHTSDPLHLIVQTQAPTAKGASANVSASGRSPISDQVAEQVAVAEPMPDGVHRYAGSPSRFAAFVVDSVIVYLLWIAMAIVATILSLFAVPLGASAPARVAFIEVTGLASVTLGSFLYYAIGNGTGATIGKRLFGLKVVSTVDAKPIGSIRSCLRNIMFMIGAVCVVGLLQILWNKQKQGWHDQVAQSVVVRARGAPNRSQHQSSSDDILSASSPHV